jgi:hypothetical protein
MLFRENAIVISWPLRPPAAGVSVSAVPAFPKGALLKVSLRTFYKMFTVFDDPAL